jgi:hypothetical protein
MPIVILLPGFREMVMHVWLDDTFGKVKAKIHDNEDIDVNVQVLTRMGVEVDDNSTIGNLSIMAGAKFILELL